MKELFIKMILIKNNKISINLLLLAVASIPVSVGLMNSFFLLSLIFVFLSNDVRVYFLKSLGNTMVRSSLILWFLFCVGLFWSITDINDALIYLKKYSVLLFPFLFSPLMTEKSNRKKLIDWFMGSMTLILFITYILLLSSQDSFYIQLNEKIDIAFNVQNGFKSHIITNILMAFFLYLSFLRAIVRTSKIKFFYLFLGILTTHYVFFISAGSTGQIIAIILIFFLLYKLLNKAIFFISLLAFSIFSFMGYSNIELKNKYYFKKIPETLESILTKDRLHLGRRPQLYENAIKIWLDRPLFGTGTGGYNFAFREKLPEIYYKTPGAKRNPHNEYLHFLIQFGVIGFFLLIRLFYKNYTSIKTLKSLEEKNYALGLLIVFLVAAAGNSIIMDSGEGHFWAIMSMAFFAGKGIEKLNISKN